MSTSQIGILFFLQLACILLICRLVGLLARKIGQPQVVAEMIAGVVLGPSLLGLFLPGVQKALFPAVSTSVIYSVSQVGLVLYMFLVGIEFEVRLVRQQSTRAIAVSLAGILMPCVLGALLALGLANQAGLFSPQVVLWQRMLFMGAAISITAFPMLARIIVERGLAGTPMGTLALAAGSLDDAIAWTFLAILLAIFNKNGLTALFAVGGIIGYILVVTLGLRPLLKPLNRRVEREGKISAPVLAFILILLLLCAWLTDTFGTYAIFGAFILGTAMPRGPFSFHLLKTLEPLVLSLLLPLFFVYSGLNTRLDLVNTPLLWGITGLILLGALGGKWVACWLAARFVKVPNREALAIASLMNARGLIELILLNICLQRGLITTRLFTMLVFMAIVTTLMAYPLFELVYGRLRKSTNPERHEQGETAPTLALARTSEEIA